MKFGDVGFWGGKKTGEPEEKPSGQGENQIWHLGPFPQPTYGTWALFSKAPETFRARKAIAKSRTLRLQSCFIHKFLKWSEASFIQEISGVYTSPFLWTDELKMALRTRQVSGAFEKRAPGRNWIQATPAGGDHSRQCAIPVLTSSTLKNAPITP